MKIVTDIHLHSKWSRACSKELILTNIAKACERKGIQLVGTSDALHPAWRKEIGEQLSEVAPGTFQLKDGSSKTHFLLSTEVSCIYKKGDKTRRVHHLILFPTLKALDNFTKALERKGANLKSDGRPIIGIHSEELIKLALDTDQTTLFVPAHAWTPWYSIFGSKSGFDSIEECFGEMTKYIYAIETGLSSNPEMNWRLSQLDNLFLLSNSDAHSCENIGREANVFDMDSPSYKELYRIISEHDQTKFIETIEFFPEEGKYHVDGHAMCNFWCEPEQTKKLQGICPKCNRSLTVGVLSRVMELADRKTPAAQPPKGIPFRSIIPLQELIALVIGVGKTSKRARKIYDTLVRDGRSEFDVLLEMSLAELRMLVAEEFVLAIKAMRENSLQIKSGYDGIYGTIKPIIKIHNT